MMPTTVAPMTDAVNGYWPRIALQVLDRAMHDANLMLQLSTMSQVLSAAVILPAGDGGDDEHGFFAGGDFFGERGVGRVVGEVFVAGVEADHGAAFGAAVVADGAFEIGVFLLDCVEDARGRNGRFDRQGNFLLGNAGEDTEVDWEDYADHGASGLPISNCPLPIDEAHQSAMGIGQLAITT